MQRLLWNRIERVDDEKSLRVPLSHNQKNYLCLTWFYLSEFRSAIPFRDTSTKRRFRRSFLPIFILSIVVVSLSLTFDFGFKRHTSLLTFEVEIQWVKFAKCLFSVYWVYFSVDSFWQLLRLRCPLSKE